MRPDIVIDFAILVLVQERDVVKKLGGEVEEVESEGLYAIRRRD